MKRIPKKAVTIDGLFSRDLDDAIWVTENDDSYTLEVTIADVSSIVNSSKSIELYEKAFEQSETRYFRHSNDPMLPRYLSEDALSLLPGASRPGITFTMVLGKSDLDVISFSAERSSFKSLKKMHYEEVDFLITEKKSESAIEKMIMLANKLARHLLEKRRLNGALAIYDVNNGWCVTEEGRMIKMPEREAYWSHIIIQEFMILTNATVTEHLLKNNVNIVLRNHTTRTAAIPRETLLEQLAYLALHPSNNQLMLMQKKLNLTLNRAQYGTKLWGHYGLNLPAYAHWTSPIRRFADLVNHEILNAWLDGKQHPYTQERLDEICMHINDVREKLLDEKRDYFKLKNIQEQGGMVGAPVQPKYVGEMLKKAAKSDAPPSPQLLEAVHLKINRGTLDPREFFQILFNPKFELESLRKEALESLRASKHLAISVLLLAEQAKSIGTVSFDVKRTGEKFIGQASVEVDGKTITSQKSVPTNQKEAKQLASLDLIFRIVEGGTYASDTVAIPTVSLKDMKNGDYVSALHLYDALSPLGLEFKYETHESTGAFRCVAGATVGQDTIEVKSEWLSGKKAAKSQSAKLLYEQVKLMSKK